MEVNKNYKKIIAISDIHGCYNQLMNLLKYLNYDPKKYQICFLGDYQDRGPDSIKVVKKVKELVDNDNAVALKGNHESMFLQWIKFGEKANSDYLKKYGATTVESYKSELKLSKKSKLTDSEEAMELIHFLDSLPMYAESENNIFVHAGINSNLKNWRKSGEMDFLWSRRAFWEAENNTGKTIIFGHTPVFNFPENNDSAYPYIFPDGTRICIDGGCVFGRQLNALIIDKNKYSCAYSKLKQKTISNV